MSLTSQDIVTAFKKHPVGFSCGLVAVLLAIGLYVRSGTIPELETTLEERTAVGEKGQNNIKNSALLDEQLAAMEGAVAQINARAIDRSALADNLQYFYQLEAEYGIKIVELRPESVSVSKTQATYVEAPFVLGAQGTYRQLLTLLRAIEKGRRFARVDTARFSPSSGPASISAANGEPVLLMTLNLKLLAKS
tara:strand:- start:63 stop:641 length:579 start_codon:yes stop_codon:yes gene_type:complete